MRMNDSAPLRSRGQSITEVAFLLPVLLLLILGAVDVAQVLSSQQHLEQAAYVAALRLRSAPSLGTDATGLRTWRSPSTSTRMALQSRRLNPAPRRGRAFRCHSGRGRIPTPLR